MPGADRLPHRAHLRASCGGRRRLRLALRRVRRGASETVAGGTLMQPGASHEPEARSGSRWASLVRGISLWSEASVNRRIFSASVRVGGANLIARGALVLRELTIAYTLGTSTRVSAFLLAALIPT